jgi:two-component system, NtrC family, nitrogen regulation sensor histidine kinase GlnL
VSDRLEAILDSLTVGIVAVDAHGRVERQNAEASRILGLSAGATAGRSLADVLGAAHPLAELAGRVLESQRELALHAASLPRLRGGPLLLVDLGAAPLALGDTFEGAVLTLRDRTIHRELEALVDERLRDELYEQLAAGIAHEIRNPLSGIRGAAELLARKLGDSELARYPQLIRAETDRIRSLLDDLAQLTHGGDLRPRAVNLHQVLDNMLTLASEAPEWRGLEIVREYDPSIPELELDPDRITQVFLNLVRNAAQAMEGRGRLRLQTRYEGLFQIGSAHEERQRVVRVDVEDTGPGIRSEDLPHIFTPFFTRRTGGGGLGLAIAQHWVVRHGGRIGVARSDAQGTRMSVKLPARRPA